MLFPVRIVVAALVGMFASLVATVVFPIAVAFVVASTAVALLSRTTLGVAGIAVMTLVGVRGLASLVPVLLRMGVTVSAVWFVALRLLRGVRTGVGVGEGLRVGCAMSVFKCGSTDLLSLLGARVHR